MGASGPETFIPNLRAQVTAIVDSVENIASTWEYRLAVGWTIMTRDNNNTNINICPHYVSSRELQPVNRTESKHRAIISIISSGQLSPGLVTGPPGPGPPVGGDRSQAPSPSWPELGGNYSRSPLLTPVILGRRSDFVKSDRIKMAIVLPALL